MLTYQRQFIEFCLANDVLRFGEFTLKSGRVSPYFFNAGLFNTVKLLAKLGEFYAAAIQASAIEYDVLFGPAYKGIPLVTTTAIALAQQHQIDKHYSFNRKEAKDHGEGGNIVGAPLHGNVLIIDDVVTAGTAFREAQQIIADSPATLCGLLIALDRQEKGSGERSAVQEIETDFHIPVISIITLRHLIEYLQEQPQRQDQLAKIQEYQSVYSG